MIRSIKHLSFPTLLLLATAVVLCGTIITNQRPDIPENEITNRPIAIVEDGYVSSTTCQACHPAQYDTWSGSFHRTMTQVANPETVQADFDEVTVSEVEGTPMRLERRGDEFWAEFDDPGWEGPSSARPRITRQVVMITGSHHQNIYWYATEHDRALNVLPGVFLLNDERWVPRSSVVLSPPNQGVATLDGHWNAICIDCHTTHGKTQFDTPFRSEPISSQSVDTTVAEFGISCESCHGPAETHVDTNRNPWRRYAMHLSGEPDATIVNPVELDPVRSSQVCGQCHSIWEFYNSSDERVSSTSGLAYRPGDELRDTRFVAHPTTNANSPEMQQLLNTDPDFIRGSFWSDGQVRVSGREYNGLIDSPCFQNADTTQQSLSCFSCHTMHKTAEDPRSVSTWADTHQVSAGMDDNTACTQCHQEFTVDVSAHTNHGVNSSGSSCYNCHMPYTSYGLLRSIRSHTVTTPSIQESVEVGRPNACNLCHLDQTLEWSGEHLRDWYDLPMPPLKDDERNVAASILWLLTGDAGQRAITVSSYGWEPAQTASGTTWMIPYLGELLGDPYAAVRYIAADSMRSLPGYEGLNYDFVATREERFEHALDALTTWRNSTQSGNRRDPQLLFNEDGSLDTAKMRQFFSLRNTRPLFLRE
tara:strand:- start:8829 stop:10766 length:1938 start_codon:yes stop_codon:yes gene_type:complete